MYYDQSVIKEQLEINLTHKFGDSIKNDVLLLINQLAGKDTFINNHLLINLQNLLSLDATQAKNFLHLALELVPVSAFAPVLLLEKIPTLFFYGVADEVLPFLSTIRHYGARAIALFLGSDQLKTEDLLDVLEQSTIAFYKALLNAVQQRHEEFGVCCAMIMRFSAKIETLLPIESIDAYLDVCATVIKQYSTKIAEQYIRNAPTFISYVPLKETIVMLEHFAKKSLFSLEFSVTHPTLFFSPKTPSKGLIVNSHNNTNIKTSKIELLASEDYATLLDNLNLLDDKDFASLVLSWPDLNQALKSNILFQLRQDNYKHYIIKHPNIEQELNQINQATAFNWLEPWTYSGVMIDLSFIRKRIGTLLQEPNNFSLASKSIIKNHAEIFDRSNTNYDGNRISNMLNILLNYCINSLVKEELIAMREFATGNHLPLRDFLSRSALVIQAWNRDPWVDYGRSDELFSCTSLGDYNAGNAPGFLADLNLNNLDIWSGGARVGRIHLCLVKNLSSDILLLLDCVDGTERIVGSKKKFEFIMTAVLDYARRLGIKQVKVNCDVDFNTTPKKFIHHVQQIYHGKNTVDFASRILSVSTVKHLLPYPCQTFTESFIKGNGAFIRGPLIELKKLDTQ